MRVLPNSIITGSISLTTAKHNMSLSVFDFENHDVRFVGTWDAPEWIAQDVCGILGIKNISDAVGRLRPNQKGVVITDTLGGQQEMLTVKESGLYALIFKSRKTVAERFQDWVFEEVLPSIRKNGYYVSPDQHQSFQQARVSGKFSRRSLTDAIQSYVKRHPELSDNAKRWIYKNVTDSLYRQVYDKQAKKLVELIGCDKGHLRDNLNLDELVVISSIEDTAIRLIDNDCEPQEAMVQAASRVMAIGLFSDRHALPG